MCDVKLHTDACMQTHCMFTRYWEKWSYFHAYIGVRTFDTPENDELQVKYKNSSQPVSSYYPRVNLKRLKV